VDINSDYTNSDHESRDLDVYALAKYRWTLRTLKGLNVPVDAKIANIGCGSGTFTKILADTGFRVFATEPDSVPFEFAKSRLPKNCVIENIGLFDIVGGEQFDVVVMHDVLEHIESDIEAIKKLHSIIVPGGLLLISVPALRSLYGHHDVQLGHYRRYSQRTLKQVVSVCFDIKSLKYFGFLSIPIVLLISKILKKDYPSNQDKKSSLLLRLYGVICDLESRVVEPLGTSLLLVAFK